MAIDEQERRRDTLALRRPTATILATVASAAFVGIASLLFNVNNTLVRHDTQIAANAAKLSEGGRWTREDHNVFATRVLRDSERLERMIERHIIASERNIDRLHKRIEEVSQQLNKHQNIPAHKGAELQFDMLQNNRFKDGNR